MPRPDRRKFAFFEWGFRRWWDEVTGGAPFPHTWGDGEGLSEVGREVARYALSFLYVAHVHDEGPCEFEPCRGEPTLLDEGGLDDYVEMWSARLGEFHDFGVADGVPAVLPAEPSPQDAPRVVGDRELLARREGRVRAKR